MERASDKRTRYGNAQEDHLTALAAVQTPQEGPEVSRVQEKCRNRKTQLKRFVRRKAETPPGAGFSLVAMPRLELGT